MLIFSFSEAAAAAAEEEKEKGWHGCSDIVYCITHCAADGDEDASLIISPSSFTQYISANLYNLMQLSWMKHNLTKISGFFYEKNVPKKIVSKKKRFQTKRLKNEIWN